MKKKITNIITAIVLFLTFTVPAFADGIGCTGDTGLGPFANLFCKPKDTAAAEQAGIQLNKVISTIIGVMTAVAAIWFIFQFIVAGYQWIQSGGEKNALSEARDKITNSLIGLIIVVGAWLIIGVVGQVLGLEILNPGKLLLDLGK